jgi:adenylate kinase family enzyme
MTRIVVLGCAGAGKSTLARRLAEAAGAPLISLDAIWQEGWGVADVPGFRAILTELHAREAWISDGNFAVASFDIRLPRADLLVWLEPPRWLCLLRATLRVLRPGETHRLRHLPRVLRFIWNFDRVNRPKIEAERAAHAPDAPLLRLRTGREVDALLDDWTANHTHGNKNAGRLAAPRSLTS